MTWPFAAVRQWWCARKDGHNWMIWYEPGFLADQTLCLRCKKRGHL